MSCLTGSKENLSAQSLDRSPIKISQRSQKKRNLMSVL